MHRSINIAANFMFKLHVAALDSPLKEINLYPVMDGFYATAKSRQILEGFLRSVLKQCATTFAAEKNMGFRFVVRGAIAFGHVYHGSEVADAGSKRLTENPNYRASLVLGPPIVDANRSEKDAPPFGIAIHQSAKSNAPAGSVAYVEEWWPWFDETFDKAGFCAQLRSYYAWCQKESGSLKYEVQRILFHEYLSLKYFA